MQGCCLGRRFGVLPIFFSESPKFWRVIRGAADYSRVESAILQRFQELLNSFQVNQLIGIIYFLKEGIKWSKLRSKRRLRNSPCLLSYPYSSVRMLSLFKLFYFCFWKKQHALKCHPGRKLVDRRAKNIPINV